MNVIIKTGIIDSNYDSIHISQEGIVFLFIMGQKVFPTMGATPLKGNPFSDSSGGGIFLGGGGGSGGGGGFSGGGGGFGGGSWGGGGSGGRW